MMLLAFVFGIVLQLFVIEVPGVSDVFNTANLSWQEWLVTLALSISPLVVHEIVVLYKMIHNLISQKEAN